MLHHEKSWYPTYVHTKPQSLRRAWYLFRCSACGSIYLIHTNEKNKLSFCLPEGFIVGLDIHTVLYTHAAARVVLQVAVHHHPHQLAQALQTCTQRAGKPSSHASVGNPGM